MDTLCVATVATAFESLIGPGNLLTAMHILLQNSCFKRVTREHESHNHLSFGRLFVNDHI